MVLLLSLSQPLLRIGGSHEALFLGNQFSVWSINQSRRISAQTQLTDDLLITISIQLKPNETLANRLIDRWMTPCLIFHHFAEVAPVGSNENNDRAPGRTRLLKRLCRRLHPSLLGCVQWRLAKCGAGRKQTKRQGNNDLGTTKDGRVHDLNLSNGGKSVAVVQRE